MIFFTSDTHIGDGEILTLTDGRARPFETITQMRDLLIKNAQTLMTDDDTLYHLGDVVRGDIEEELKIFSEYPGKKYLIAGNHDKIFPKIHDQNEAEYYKSLYENAGFEILPLWHTITVTILDGDEQEILLSHMPYRADEPDDLKYLFGFPPNNGLYHLHGHYHAKTTTKPGSPLELNVCVDANNWCPVPMADVVKHVETKMKENTETTK